MKFRVLVLAFVIAIAAFAVSRFRSGPGFEVLHKGPIEVLAVGSSDGTSAPSGTPRQFGLAFTSSYSGFGSTFVYVRLPVGYVAQRFGEETKGNTVSADARVGKEWSAIAFTAVFQDPETRLWRFPAATRKVASPNFVLPATLGRPAFASATRYHRRNCSTSTCPRWRKRN